MILKLRLMCMMCMMLLYVSAVISEPWLLWAVLKYIQHSGWPNCPITPGQVRQRRRNLKFKDKADNECRLWIFWTLHRSRLLCAYEQNERNSCIFTIFTKSKPNSSLLCEQLRNFIQQKLCQKWEVICQCLKGSTQCDPINEKLAILKYIPYTQWWTSLRWSVAPLF
jgi:hypothetical protein